MRKSLRETLARLLIKNPQKGDLENFQVANRYAISCVFVFYKRMDLMSAILHCLDSQKVEKDDLEVILVEDQGGTYEGKSFSKHFPSLNISYFAPDNGWAHMGYMRNYGLSKASGKYVLFLDDDTVILDRNFISDLVDLFKNKPEIQAIMPLGLASYALIKGKYEYHDPYFFTNRCMAYRRSCLVELGGFDSNFIGQEDVEFAVRFIASGRLAYKVKELQYYHPPMVFGSPQKGMAVGASFAVSKYSPFIKILLFLNGIRWIPLFFLPGQERRNKAIFAWGFAQGFIKRLFKKSTDIGYS